MPRFVRPPLENVHCHEGRVRVLRLLDRRRQIQRGRERLETSDGRARVSTSTAR